MWGYYYDIMYCMKIHVYGDDNYKFSLPGLTYNTNITDITYITYNTNITSVIEAPLTFF